MRSIPIFFTSFGAFPRSTVTVCSIFTKKIVETWMVEYMNWFIEVEIMKKIIINWFMYCNKNRVFSLDIMKHWWIYWCFAVTCSSREQNILLLMQFGAFLWSLLHPYIHNPLWESHRLFKHLESQGRQTSWNSLLQQPSIKKVSLQFVRWLLTLSKKES